MSLFQKFKWVRVVFCVEWCEKYQSVFKVWLKIPRNWNWTDLKKFNSKAESSEPTADWVPSNGEDIVKFYSQIWYHSGSRTGRGERYGYGILMVPANCFNKMDTFFRRTWKMVNAWVVISGLDLLPRSFTWCLRVWGFLFTTRCLVHASFFSMEWSQLKCIGERTILISNLTGEKVLIYRRIIVRFWIPGNIKLKSNVCLSNPVCRQ